MLKVAAIAAASLVALAACQPGAKNTAADETEIAGLNQAWATGYNAGDADAVANLYAEDGVVMAPGTKTLEGRAAIREFIASDSAAAKAAGLTMNITGGAKQMAGDLAFETGTFAVTDAAGATVDAGKYVSVVKKVNGKWFLFRDIWNSDNAPAPAAAPAAAAPAS